jgi:hypothetical protein
MTSKPDVTKLDEYLLELFAQVEVPNKLVPGQARMIIDLLGDKHEEIQEVLGEVTATKERVLDDQHASTVDKMVAIGRAVEEARIPEMTLAVIKQCIATLSSDAMADGFLTRYRDVQDPEPPSTFERIEDYVYKKITAWILKVFKGK